VWHTIIQQWKKHNGKLRWRCGPTNGEQLHFLVAGWTWEWKFSLTPSMPYCIGLHMGRFLHIILVFIFIIAGISQVPACYATKPNCVFKATTTCPMAEAQPMAASDESTPSCLLEDPAGKQQSTDSFPLERLKRLKIDQIQYDATLLISFIPALFSNIIIEQPQTHLTNNPLSHRFVNPHHRPPPLFIQHQSFLI